MRRCQRHAFSRSAASSMSTSWCAASLRSPAIQASLNWRRLPAYTSCATTWKYGADSISSSRTAARSACLPGSIEPMRASQPSTRAPPSVAMCNAVAASTTLASPATPFASSAAVRISPTMSRSLLLAQPSVPSATSTPAASSFATGQKPLASLRFDSGQCTTPTPSRAQSSISASLSCVMCTAISELFTRPSFCSRASGRSPCSFFESSTSCAVSCVCRCTRMSSWSASMRTRSNEASATV